MNSNFSEVKKNDKGIDRIIEVEIWPSGQIDIDMRNEYMGGIDQNTSITLSVREFNAIVDAVKEMPNYKTNHDSLN